MSDALPARRVRVAVVGAGVAGVATALEAAHRGIDPRSITVLEARPAATLARNLTIDRFTRERLAALGVASRSLALWNEIELTLGDAANPARFVVPPWHALGRSAGPRPSLSPLARVPDATANLAELQRAMRRAAAAAGVAIATGWQVTGVTSRGGRSARLALRSEGRARELECDDLVLACGAGSDLLPALGIEREPLRVPQQTWLIAVLDRPARFPLAIRVVTGDRNGMSTVFALSSTVQTSVGLRLNGQRPDEPKTIDAMARGAAATLRLEGDLVDAFVYSTRMDRPRPAPSAAQRLLVGDALRRSDVTYGGGANSAIVDAHWAGRLLAGEIAAADYDRQAASTTAELTGGSSFMGLADRWTGILQSGTALVPAPLRAGAGLALQGLAASFSAPAWRLFEMLRQRR